MKPVIYTISLETPLSDRDKKALLRMLPEGRRERLPKGHPERWDQPLAAWGLLALGCREAFGLEALPETAWEPGGRPWFPQQPDCWFSLSHTEGAAACGLWNRPIGVDIQAVKPVAPRLRALLGAKDDLEGIRRWACREAAAKRLGLGGVATLRCPVEGEESCWLLDGGKGYALAASAEEAPRVEPLSRKDFWLRWKHTIK